MCDCPNCQEQIRKAQPKSAFETLVDKVGVKNFIRLACFTSGIFGAVIVNALLSVI